MRPNCGAEARRHRVAPRFLQVIEHVLAGGFAVRVLNGGIHPREHAQVVQPPLDVGDARSAKAGRPDSESRLRFTMLGRVILRPVVTTWRTNCACLP